MSSVEIIAIFVLTVITVISIVSKFRFRIEERIREKYGVDRDWWVPPLALIFAFTISVVEVEHIITGFIENIDIIILIFSFSIIADGLGSSGFFKYISYKFIQRCNEQTTKLVLYMFVLTSIITLFTSNDIVILVMTPIIVGICFQAKIKNTKIILLSQFIAANTVSMGILIGSPTNIIIAEQLNINFFVYTAIMIIPTFIAFLTSLLVVYIVLVVSGSNRTGLFNWLEVQETYNKPQENPEPDFTPHMRNWLLIFATLVVLVAIVTFLDVSLLWCAVPSIVIGLTYWVLSSNHMEHVRKPVQRIPYGVFFFGITFFIFAEAFAQTDIFNTVLIPLLNTLLEENEVLSIITAIVGSGMTVNIFNDLPASAIIAQVLAGLSFDEFIYEMVIVQMILAGLNIGTYLTQAGALAGILWFSIIRIERKKREEEYPSLAEEVQLPSRTELIKYGFIHFVMVSIILVLFALVQLSILTIVL